MFIDLLGNWRANLQVCPEGGPVGGRAGDIYTPATIQPCSFLILLYILLIIIFLILLL